MGDYEGCSNLDWKAVFTSSARVFVCSQVWECGRGGGITANLFIRFHYRQERGNTARIYILSWCGVSSKLDIVATKNVQDSVLCKLHSWFLLNKTFPRHLASKCYISQDTSLVLISPALK